VVVIIELTTSKKGSGVKILLTDVVLIFIAGVSLDEFLRVFNFEGIVPHEYDGVLKETYSFFQEDFGEPVSSDVQNLELHDTLLDLFFRGLLQIRERPLNISDFVIFYDQNL
jgi:hypothetical protein